MSHHLSALLEAWLANADTTEWVLGTVYTTVEANFVALIRLAFASHFA